MNSASIRVEITHNQLSDVLKEEMWQVYAGYYHYEKAYFLARFDKNTHYALYWHNDRLVGFTGLRINQPHLDGRQRLTMYFGQTVLKEAYRGSNLMQKTGMRLVQRYWKEILFGEAYWWADALTFRAYLAFSRSTVEHYPNYQEPVQPELKSVVDYIGETHYGDTYDAKTGTVKKPCRYVADPGANIPTDCSDPDILFFAERNPRHQHGHGLLTLAPVNVRNLIYLLNRLWFKAKRRPTRKVSLTPTSASSDSQAA